VHEQNPDHCLRKCPHGTLNQNGRYHFTKQTRRPKFDQLGNDRKSTVKKSGSNSCFITLRLSHHRDFRSFSNGPTFNRRFCFTNQYGYFKLFSRFQFFRKGTLRDNNPDFVLIHARDIVASPLIIKKIILRNLFKFVSQNSCRNFIFKPPGHY